MQLRIDMSDVERFEGQLESMKRTAIPFANRSALNRGAFHAQKTGREIIEQKMVVRDRFALRSVQVDMARGLAIPQQEAIVGSVADYMADQEFGAVKVSQGKEGTPITTSYASGEGEHARPRRKLARKPNRLRNIRLHRRRRRPAGQPKNAKQELLFKVQDAVESGRRVFYHDMRGGQTKGIFRVLGGRKGFKRGWPKGARLKMLHDLSRKSVTVPRNPWLMPAARETIKEMPRFYRDALLFQLQRLR